MAYNNFPVGYQPYYPQYNNYTQQQAQSQAQSNLIWVQGEAGAKSYLVAPNNTVQLWDSERQTIYLKSADASGMPSMRILDYTIRSDAPSSQIQAVNPSGHVEVSKSDLDALQSQIDGLKRDLEAYKSMVSDKKEMNHEQSTL